MPLHRTYAEASEGSLKASATWSGPKAWVSAQNSHRTSTSPGTDSANRSLKRWPRGKAQVKKTKTANRHTTEGTRPGPRSWRSDSTSAFPNDSTALSILGRRASSPQGPNCGEGWHTKNTNRVCSRYRQIWRGVKTRLAYQEHKYK